MPAERCGVRIPGCYYLVDDAPCGKRSDRLRLVQQLAAGSADGVILGSSTAMRADGGPVGIGSHGLSSPSNGQTSALLTRSRVEPFLIANA